MSHQFNICCSQRAKQAYMMWWVLALGIGMLRANAQIKVFTCACGWMFVREHARVCMCMFLCGCGRWGFLPRASAVVELQLCFLLFCYTKTRNCVVCLLHHNSMWYCVSLALFFTCSYALRMFSFDMNGIVFGWFSMLIHICTCVYFVHKYFFRNVLCANVRWQEEEKKRKEKHTLEFSSDARTHSDTRMCQTCMHSSYICVHNARPTRQ